MQVAVEHDLARRIESHSSKYRPAARLPGVSARPQSRTVGNGQSPPGGRHSARIDRRDRVIGLGVEPRAGQHALEQHCAELAIDRQHAWRAVAAEPLRRVELGAEPQHRGAPVGAPDRLDVVVRERERAVVDEIPARAQLRGEFVHAVRPTGPAS